MLQEWNNFAALVAELLVTKDLYGDAFTCVRRTREMTLAAEIQWELLPPLTFTTREMAISGMLEPSYDIGGDTFDYAVNDGVLHLAIIDAMGRGLPASLLAGAIVASYRHSRRRGHGLSETFSAIDGIVAEHFGPDQFATLQLVQFEFQTGRLEWLNAGHPLPLLLRAGKTVKTLECNPSLPAGLNGTVAEIAQQWLEPEDQVLFFTDGMVEARSPSGEMFGESYLGEVFAREAQVGLPPAETTRRITRSVLAHLGHQPRDDVTDVLIQWKGRQLPASSVS
jgi:serine phosphatase RsbU (regulator of sigma subunit)